MNAFEKLFVDSGASIRVPDGRQPLLVPAHLRQEAKNFGARYHPDLKLWSVALENACKVPRPMLPIRDRPGLDPPYLRINLIPQTSWGRNMRALMPKDEWRAFARNHVYSKTGYVCLVCGGRGPQWPVEADEVWRFEHSSSTQRLHNVVPLCPACHEVRTCGFATAQGRQQEVAKHLAWVERISVKLALTRIKQALSTWEDRSQKRWKIDLTYAHERYGLKLEHADDMTDKVNASLVAQASRRHRKGRNTLSIEDALQRMIYG